MNSHNRLRQLRGLMSLLGVVLACGAVQSLKAQASRAEPDWSYNATIIGACSCPVMCPCFFTTKPAAHVEHEGHEMVHFCRFNEVSRINAGRWGGIKLDGAKFWLAGNLGDDFSKGQLDWAVLTFDPSVTATQRDAIRKILGLIFRDFKWRSFQEAQDASIRWEADATSAAAFLDGGKAGELRLRADHPSQNTQGQPVVIRNVRMPGYPRNDGVSVMPNEIEAYRLGEKAFEYKGSMGFVTTVHARSLDFKK